MKKTQNIVYYRGIGAVEYLKSMRARNFSIRINQRGEVKVTIPRYGSIRRAEAFLISREQWVLNKLDQFREAGCNGKMPAEGELILIRGKEFSVVLLRSDSGIEDAIWRMLRKEADSYLPDRVLALASAYGYKYTGLKIRRMKTRWGSCTARKSINLNSWLMMLPDYLSDYVILHELAHTRFPDHGKRFWEELDRTTMGQSRNCRKELRTCQIMCFPGEQEA
jgi:predicted metal-dependent hydrolase